MTDIKQLRAGIYLLFAILLMACESPKSKDSASALTELKSVEFAYSEVKGIGQDSVYNRRDPSDILKVDETYLLRFEITSDTK
ncbi:MAG: hypothetical protein MI866_02035 [Bacteroidales bacterium]|nr:hypothetical protein [Bacteroidales bacterium]